MRITTSRAARAFAAVAAAGLLTVGCSSDDVPSVGEMTEGAKSAAESGMSKAESAKNNAESELNDASASGSAAGEDGSGESTQVNSPSGEAVTVQGATLAKYNESGGAEGKLGAPLGAAEEGPDGGSCQEFERGLICDGGSTDAQIVWGEIRKAWEGQDGQNGELGYPTGDEELNGGTYSQEFEHGSISWSGGEPEITKN
jgi:uncharacterized protein with LGFP repeats